MTNTIQDVVTHTKRVGTSTMGNPTYEVEIRDDRNLDSDQPLYSLHRTMSNTMLAYAIENPEYRDHVHEFTLTRAGRLRSARRVD